MRLPLSSLVIATSLLLLPCPAAEPEALTPLQQDILRHLDTAQPELISANQDLWAYAEVGLQEYRSAARLV